MDREQVDYKVFMSTDLKDFFGFDIKVGDRLLKPEVYGSSSPTLVRCTVTRIDGKKMYLDNSKVAIQYPRRCVNISALRTMGGLNVM